ncbi:MAG: tetratricopeptide repeat protein [Lunatimonas sp.]|uniref:tetratricopeptide repeat protein n=1 Tax=Lunatimonas sp. TaxID=2060141 RepID=UPI00263B5237|nr:tetratricopeptide repeat protein [Lunatimonas sp.]MCC5936663.1 tetratricopeptide repeat protein [Lunatimonas sp.]
MKIRLIVFFVVIFHWKGTAQSTLYQRSTEKLFHDALELYQKDQFAASKIAFTRLLAMDLSESKQVASSYYLASSALKSENPDGPSMLETFIVNHPNEPLGNEAAIELGNHFFLARNYPKAIEAYRRIDADFLYGEKKAEVLFKTGYAFFMLKNYRESIQYLEEAKRYRSDYLADAYYYAGYAYMEQKQDEQAIRDFKEAEKARAYSGKVPYMLASIYYKRQQYDELIAYAPGILDRQGLEKKEGIQLLLAEAYFERRNHEQAAQNYAAFTAANKGRLTREQQYKAGVSHYHVGRYAEASNYFKEVALGNDRLGQVSSYYLGHAYIKLNNPQFASNSFSAAFKADFDPQIKEEALFNYAKVNLERGSFQDAVNALDTYLEQYRNGPHAREAENLLSDALINTNNYLRAIEHMDKMPNKSERIKAAYQKVAFYQAMVYYRDGKYGSALQMLNKSQTYPIDKNLAVQTQFWKGETHAANNKLDEAIKAYEAVISMRPNARDPSLIKTHYGLGYAYFNTQRYSQAEGQFKAYTDKLRNSRDRENYDDALIRLGDVYYVQKKFRDALDTFNRAIRENNPYTDYAYFRVGVIHNFENRNNEAIEQLNRVISGFPTSRYFEDALFQRAQINMEMTRYEDARAGFSELISNRANSPFIPYALEGRAVANYSIRDYEGAIRDYKAILDNHPNAANVESALVGLQESLTLQGRAGEFSTYLANYKRTNPGSSSLQTLEFETAKNLFFNQSYSEAIRSFENFIRSYPNVTQVPEAQFFIGDSYFRLGDKNKALEYFYLVEKTQEVSLKNRAIQRIGTLEFEKGNYTEAIRFLRVSVRNARTKLDEYESLNSLMDAFYRTKQYDSATVYANRIIGLGDITIDATPKALLVKGKSQLEKGQVNDARNTFKELYSTFKTVQGAEALYLMALSFHDANMFAASNDLIFDESQPFGPYDFWYGKQFILLAKNYLKLNETFQAKATLESIVENSPNDQVKEEARQLLRTIN